MSSLSVPRADLQAVADRASSVERLLLLCGAMAAVVYIGLDLIAASQYPGYTLRDRAISELSASGAPTARLWAMVSPLFALFLVAFAIGVWRGTRLRAFRLTATLMLALVALGPLWALFPMQQRGNTFGAQDAAHIALAAASVVLITAFMIAGAVASGGWFRIASVPVIGVVLVGFAWTFAMAARLAANTPTPWLGVVERAGIYGYLLWIATLALLLFQRSAAHPREP